MKETIIKNCQRHGETEHAYYSGKLKCKKCMVEYDYNKRHKIKSILVEYKGGKCEICNYNKCLNALDFHHKNSNEKEFALNTANYNKSLKILKKEADKCILVCANCHREIHYNENEERRARYIYKNIDRAKVLSALNLEEIKNDIKNGLKQEDIAIKYNVSLSSVKRFYAKHNLSKKRFSCDINEFLNSFKEKPTYSYLCKKYNITIKVVRKFCVDNNLIEEMNNIRRLKGFKPLANKHMFK